MKRQKKHGHEEISWKVSEILLTDNTGYSDTGDVDGVMISRGFGTQNAPETLSVERPGLSGPLVDSVYGPDTPFRPVPGSISSDRTTRCTSEVVSVVPRS